MNNQQLWNAVLGELELSISRAHFLTWLKNTALDSHQDGEVTVIVPNQYAKEWLEKKYRKHIFKSLCGIARNVSFKKITFAVGNVSEVKGRTAPIKQTVSINSSTSFAPTLNPQSNQESVSVPVAIDKNSNLNPRYTFNDFVVGNNNELARAAAMAVVESPGTHYNPLFIYGGVGLGKTHIMHAIGNELLAKNSQIKVKYISCERFANELVASIERRTTSKFKEEYITYDVLIIDDVQFLSGREKTQEEFFHIFNSLHGANKQIIISSDRPPNSIPTLEDRLRSRFQGGMIADISSPDLETRIAILRKKADNKKINCPDDVYHFIASHITDNIRELEGALNRVIVHCQLKGDEINLTTTQDVLATIINQPKNKLISKKHIINTVANFYELSCDDLLSSCRKKEIVQPRQVAMYLMREEIKRSFPDIGKEFSGRDHTTAMHAFKKVRQELHVNETLKQEVTLLIQKLYN